MTPIAPTAQPGHRPKKFSRLVLRSETYSAQSNCQEISGKRGCPWSPRLVPGKWGLLRFAPFIDTEVIDVAVVAGTFEVRERVEVYVSACDPVSREGIASQLRGHGVALVEERGLHPNVVALVVVEEVDEPAAQQIRALKHRGVDKVVVVATRVEDAGLVTAVEAGASGFLRRGQATAPQRADTHPRMGWVSGAAASVRCGACRRAPFGGPAATPTRASSGGANASHHAQIITTTFPTDDLVVASLVATDPPYRADSKGQQDSTNAIEAALMACYRAGGGVGCLPASRLHASSSPGLSPPGNAA